MLVNGHWYERLAPQSLSEAEFERLVVTNANELYPEYHLVPFRKLVQSAAGDRRADYALIERSFRTWWVVEVELAHHPLNAHVLPQVEVLATARYGPEEANYLARQSGLPLAKLLETVKGAQPRVFVIVNQQVLDWQAPLAFHKAAIGVVEVYRSELNEHVLRANGDYPHAPGEVLSVCRVDPLLPRFVRVDSPASLGVTNGSSIQIEYEGGVTQWTRTDSFDRVWLSPTGSNPLPLGLGQFELVRGSSGRLIFRSGRGVVK